jgi:glucose/arabinose dehydrogenase
VGQAGVRPEIWAYGLRNPWRVAFDPESELLFVADVGQSTNEEVSVVPADQEGINFGWNTMEASHCFPPNSSCSQTGLTLPVVEYPRSDGISITGGFVYRGSAIPDLQGHYLYADYGRQWIRSFRYEGGEVRDSGDLDLEGVSSISSFGVDGAGELYVVSLAGRVLKLVPDV